MELIERYVNEVGRRLPRKARTDVQAELRSALQDALEDRIEGQPSEDDVVALLKEFGRPEKVAASYRPEHQYLIGPELYPTFVMVVGIVLIVLAAVTGVFAVLGLVIEPVDPGMAGQRLLETLGGLFQGLLSALGAVVIVFAILQRLEVKPDQPETDWDPRELPVVEEHDLVGRGESIAGIAFSVIFLILLNLFVDRIGLVITFGQEPILTTIVSDNLPWLNAALLVCLALNVALLWQGRWHWYTRVINLASDLFGVYVLYRLAVALAAEQDALAAAGLPDPLPTMLVLIGYGVVALSGVLIVLENVKTAYRALRRRGPSAGIRIPSQGTPSRQG
jgi:hypothetical protein